jgi:hypothetical protein
MVALMKSKIIVVRSVGRKELSGFLSTREQILGTPAVDLSPHMIIKPVGLQHIDEIEDYLRSQDIVVTSTKVIDDWQAFSLFMYGIRSKRAKFRIAKNKVHSRLDPVNCANYLGLEDGIPEKKLHRIRSDLRSWYGEEMYRFTYGGEEGIIRTNSVHVPEYKDLPLEKKVVAYFLK